MILADVMGQLAARAGNIEGLRGYDIPDGPMNPPVFFPELPEDIDYDGTYGGAVGSLTLTGVLLAGKVDSRASVVAIRPYLDWSGERSVKAFLESGSYTAMDTVQVASAELVVRTYAAVAYLGADFTINITGKGA
jgi:hypothetical protein